MGRTTTVATRLAESASEIRERYAGSADRPLGGYLATMTVYSSVVAALTGAAVLTGRDVPAEGMSGRDVVLAAAATHKLSRLLARDPVTSPSCPRACAATGAEGRRRADHLPVLHGRLGRDRPDRRPGVPAKGHPAGYGDVRGPGRR